MPVDLLLTVREKGLEMALKESGYIHSGLTYAKGIGEPLYADEGYQSGAYIENGFPVENDDAEPEHIVVHMGPQYVVDNSDMESRFREAENNVPEHVIHLGSTVRYMPPENPTYADPDHGKKEKAKAIAEAVRLAVERGEIDADLFDAD